MSDITTEPGSIAALGDIIAGREARRAAAAAKGIPHVGEDGIVPPGIGPVTGTAVAAAAPVVGAAPARATATVRTVYRAPAGDGADLPAEVPADEVSLLKAHAMDKCGNDELRVVTVEGVAHQYVFRMPTRKEWDQYLNWQFDGRASAGQWNLLVDCMMWPGIPALTADSARQPAMIKTMVDEIEEFAAGAGAGSNVHRTEIVLATDTTEDALAPMGIPIEDAQALLTRFHDKGQLRAVSIRVSPDDAEVPENVVVIVKRPPKPVFDGLVRGVQSDAKAGAVYDAAVSCVVWYDLCYDQSVLVGAVRELLNARPGLAWSLFAPIRDMGGAGAKKVAKKL